MKLSPKGIAHLMIDEGVKYHAYKDVRGIPTIGVGFTEILGRKVTMDDTLTPEQVKQMLPVILEPYERAVDDAVNIPIYQHEFDALVCFCFNIGVVGFTNSSAVKALNKGNHQAATLYFFNWHTPLVIVPRRYNDALLFTTGEYLLK